MTKIRIQQITGKTKNFYRIASFYT